MDGSMDVTETVTVGNFCLLLMFCCLEYEWLREGCGAPTLLVCEVLPVVRPSFVFYVLQPRLAVRNPGGSGRKEPPRSRNRGLVGKTRNQVSEGPREPWGVHGGLSWGSGI